jgi:hypothetical protein
MSAGRRIASVDALRGLAVAAMLLVNNPGDWGHVYAPLQHAAWHGFTPADLIFPFFLFIVGVSAALALGPRVDAGGALAPARTAVLWRGLRIVGLGLLLHALAWWLLAKPEFRVMGVLQRIGLCFAVAGVAALHLRARGQWTLLVALLAGYGALLLFASPTLDKLGSLNQRIDTAVLGRWAYEWNPATGIAFDPEGVLSTLGALGTTLFGLVCGGVGGLVVVALDAVEQAAVDAVLRAVDRRAGCRRAGRGAPVDGPLGPAPLGPRLRAERHRRVRRGLDVHGGAGGHRLDGAAVPHGVRAAGAAGGGPRAVAGLRAGLRRRLGRHRLGAGQARLVLEGLRD